MRRLYGATLPTLLAFAALSGCKPDQTALTAAESDAVAGLVSLRAPTPEHRLDADFGNGVRLIGYDVDAQEWRPGHALHVTWYWKVDGKPKAGMRLFTQVEGDSPRRTLVRDGGSTLRWLYGPERWKKGEYLADEQALYLPADWEPAAATLYVGVRHKGRALLVESAASDGDDRVTGPTLRTITPLPRVAHGHPPALKVAYAPEPPELDGSLMDSVWKSAQSTGPFVETRTGEVAPVEATARFLWDKRYLYVGVQVNDALLRAKHHEHDEHLWEQDCVEILIAPDVQTPSYYEVQISPRGVVFDTRFAGPRTPAPFGHIDWSSGARVSISARGGLDDLERDAGYVVEIAIPWQAFSPNGAAATPPKAGESWRANVYVLDLALDVQVAAAWSPPLADDFHVPARFGTLTFEAGPAAPKPDDRVERRRAVRIPANRRPRSADGGVEWEPGVRDTLIKRQVVTKQRRNETHRSRFEQRTERLESGEGAQ